MFKTSVKEMAVVSNLLNKVMNMSFERYLRSAGDLFIYDGDYDMALTMVNKSLEISGTNLRALVLKADILFCLNRDDEALTLLNKAIELDNGFAEAYISRAGVLCFMGKNVPSLHDCEKAFELLEGSLRCQHLYAALVDQTLLLLVRMKRYRRALAILRQAARQVTPLEYEYLQASYKSQVLTLSRNRAKQKAKRKEASPVRLMRPPLELTNSQ
jgi:tetratricopeptide (TPR) repeat protein